MIGAETITDGWDHVEGMYWQEYLLRDEGRVNNNHVHTYGHFTKFKSAFAVSIDGGGWIDVKAGDKLYIPAGKWHQFKAREPMARYKCFWEVFDENGYRIPAGEPRPVEEIRPYLRDVVVPVMAPHHSVVGKVGHANLTERIRMLARERKEA